MYSAPVLRIRRPPVVGQISLEFVVHPAGRPVLVAPLLHQRGRGARKIILPDQLIAIRDISSGRNRFPFLLGNGKHFHVFSAAEMDLRRTPLLHIAAVERNFQVSFSPGNRLGGNREPEVHITVIQRPGCVGRRPDGYFPAGSFPFHGFLGEGQFRYEESLGEFQRSGLVPAGETKDG